MSPSDETKLHILRCQKLILRHFYHSIYACIDVQSRQTTLLTVPQDELKVTGCYKARQSYYLRIKILYCNFS